MGRPTLTAKARGRSECRGPFPGGDEASVVACFPPVGTRVGRGEGNRGMERSNWWNRGPPPRGYRPRSTGRPQCETATPDLNT